VSPTEAERAEIARLRDPRTIREQAEAAMALAGGGGSAFRVDLARLPDVAERVVRLMRARFPDPAGIPYHSRWRHFGTGGIDRVAAFDRALQSSGADAARRLQAHVELVITSVLLDAGAGARWSFREPDTGVTCGRSEGLALASYHLFVAGGLSSDSAVPLRADPDGLAGLSEAALGRAFQVTDENPLVGLAGRVELLRRLGAALRAGHPADALRARVDGDAIAAADILAVVLESLSTIWPGRHEIAGVNLGDVWPHSRLGLVPFHKLSQWLSYSLVEPLELAGVRVFGLDTLTGLPEYRNGGLFVDAGVLVPTDGSVTSQVHAVDSELVVEWRALTVALLDLTAVEVRRRLGVGADVLPLAKVLEGGTWLAGREIARERRPDGRPPLDVRSDGTVF
jgi:hypothetical protein